MFIQTEQTPNPATLKFLPGRPVMESGVADFTDVEDTAPSPLARHLFELGGVTGVFFGADFITVTKSEDTKWQVIKPLVLGAIMDHYTSGQPIMAEGAATDEPDLMEDDDADPDVIFVDARDVVQPDQGALFDDDNVHPSVEGSTVMGRHIADAIRSASD